MVSYLINTNASSEALKKSPEPLVIEWMKQHEPMLYISMLSVGELKYGIDRLEDGKRKQAFQTWLSTLTDRMRGRVLSYNISVATVWGQLQAKCEQEGVRLTSLDSQIAATALRYSLVIATRNEKDFRHTGVKIVNPFTR